MQTFARKHKVAIDLLELQSNILDVYQLDKEKKFLEGVVIEGLILEN